MTLRILTATEQVAAHLRSELMRGIWKEFMPGGDRLTAELGVGRGVTEAALLQLEHEGLLVRQGAGRKRRIVLPAGGGAVGQLRVALLLSDTADRSLDFMVDLKHRLREAGHSVIAPKKTLTELKMQVPRIARLVEQSAAGAWVVSGGSLEVLEWFSTRPEPAFALFGKYEGLPLPGVKPDKSVAIAAATRQLIEHGHRRIALLCRKLRRLPNPGLCERTFLNELAAHGLPTGSFNLPDWEDNAGGYHELLSSLFKVSPPTALIVDEAFLFAATQQFLAVRGLRVPGDVSLVCTDADPTFAWQEPSIAHIHWDAMPVVRCVLRWAENVSGSKRDLRQTLTPAEFVVGGSIGAVVRSESGDVRQKTGRQKTEDMILRS